MKILQLFWYPLLRNTNANTYFCRMNVEQELKLRMQLDKMHSWPDVYMFKFVLPKDEQKVADLMSHFTNKAEVVTRDSAKGNYVSITIKEVMFSTDSVIERYKSIKSIEGLLSL